MWQPSLVRAGLLGQVLTLGDEKFRAVFSGSVDDSLAAEDGDRYELGQESEGKCL